MGATMDGQPIRYARTEAVTNQEGGLEFSIEEDPDGPVHLGMRIVVVSSPSADGRSLSLQVTGSWREQKHELAPEAVAEMGAAEFETHVREHRMHASFTMPNDGWVLMGNPEWIETDAGRLLQVVLLHTVVLDGGEPTRAR